MFPHLSKGGTKILKLSKREGDLKKDFGVGETNCGKRVSKIKRGQPNFLS